MRRCMQLPQRTPRKKIKSDPATTVESAIEAPCSLLLGASILQIFDADDHRKAAGFAFTAVGIENLRMTLGTKAGNFDMFSE